MNIDLLILAAGMGSRYGGIKQMDPIGPNGEFILDYSVKYALDAGFNRVVFVIRKEIEKDFKEIIGQKWEGKIAIEYVLQSLDDIPQGYSFPERTKPWGTAHAVMAARNVINDAFAAINADDYYGPEAFKLIYEYLSKTYEDQNKFCMVAYELSKTLSENTSVSRGICEVDDNHILTKITEHLTLARNKEDGIIYDGDTAFEDNTPVSMNAFGFKRSYMDFIIKQFPSFLDGAKSNPKAEFQMPTELGKMLSDGSHTVKVLKSRDEWFGITSREDRALVVNKLKELV